MLSAGKVIVVALAVLVVTPTGAAARVRQAGPAARVGQVGAAAQPARPGIGWLRQQVAQLRAPLLCFMLVSGRSFTRKMVALAPTLEQKKRRVRTVCAAERAVSGYLSTVTLINIGLGTAVGIALWLLDIPNPALWGAMAAGLNFIPYLGALVGVIVVSLVGLLTFDGLSQVLWPALAYLTLNVLEGWLVTPRLLGSRFKLSSVAIIISLLFWGWLWGIVGTLLAVPILASLQVAGQHFGPLHWLSVLAGPAMNSANAVPPGESDACAGQR